MHNVLRLKITLQRRTQTRQPFCLAGESQRKNASPLSTTQTTVTEAPPRGGREEVKSREGGRRRRGKGPRLCDGRLCDGGRRSGARGGADARGRQSRVRWCAPCRRGRAIRRPPGARQPWPPSPAPLVEALPAPRPRRSWWPAEAASPASDADAPAPLVVALPVGSGSVGEGEIWLRDLFTVCDLYY